MPICQLYMGRGNPRLLHNCELQNFRCRDGILTLSVQIIDETSQSQAMATRRNKITEWELRVDAGGHSQTFVFLAIW
jgi:hypothetical protein